MLSIVKTAKARGRAAGLVAAHRKLGFRKFDGAPSGRWWARNWPDSSGLPVGLSLDEARNPGQGVNARRRCSRLAGVPGLVSGLPGLRVLAHGWRLIHRPTVHQTSATAKPSYWICRGFPARRGTGSWGRDALLLHKRDRLLAKNRTTHLLPTLVNRPGFPGDLLV